MKSSLIFKNILVTLVRDSSGRGVSRVPREVDFIAEMSEKGISVLSDEEIIQEMEKKLRRVADHVLHSAGVREDCARTGSFTWDDFVEKATNEELSRFNMHRFEEEEAIVRHIAIVVNRAENLMPDLSDGHVYLFTGRRHRRLVATVSVNLQSGTMTGDFSEPISPEGEYVLAFRDHDDLIPLSIETGADGMPALVISQNGEFISKTEG